MKRWNFETAGIRSEHPEDLTPMERRKMSLSAAMHKMKPEIKDFKGARGYKFTDELERDEAWLRSKNSTFVDNEDTEEARQMESMLAYVLGDIRLFPTRKGSFAFLASDYDDKRNGVDVVFGIRNKNNDEFTVFSVDAATGTHPANIQDKFDKSFDKRQGKTSVIKYCSYLDRKWKEHDAPHFVLGISPASQDNLMNHIIFDGDNLKGREEDADTDFMILSEMCEQIFMQLSDNRLPSDDKARGKLSNLLSAIIPALLANLNIDGGLPKDEKDKLLNERYKMRSDRLKKKDAVYNNIISAAKQRAFRNKTIARGAKVMPRAAEAV